MRAFAMPLLMLVAVGAPATAQESVAMSWSAAERQFLRSAEASAADHGARSAELTAESLRTLRRPTVNLSAQLITYQKTLSVDLAGIKDRTRQDIRNYLGTLPGEFPSDLQSIVHTVSGRIDSALPGLLGAIPESLDYQARDTLFRPTVTAFLPLYTGGQSEPERPAPATIGPRKRSVNAIGLSDAHDAKTT